MRTIKPIFKPRPYQRPLFEEFFFHGKRRAIRICHRRFGKDTEAFNLLWMMALVRPGLYLHLLPKINQAKTVIWQGRGKEGQTFLDYIPDAVVEKVNNATMRIRLINGSIIMVTGADNYEALIGSNPMGIVFSEYQNTNPLAWDLLRPILAENDGFAVFIGTPRGHNHFYEMYNQNLGNEEWFVSKLTVDDTFYEDGTPVISKSVIESERKAGMPEAIIQQEFYCSFEAAVQGAYYSAELNQARQEQRIGYFGVRPELPVHTAWDIGMKDPTSIGLYQVHPNGDVVCIHYLENYRKPVEFYAKELGNLQRILGFQSYGFHFAPHDIRVQEWGTGKTRIEQAKKFGINFKIVGNVGIHDGIEAVRTIFPKLKFNEIECMQLIRAMAEYHSSYDEKRKVYSHKPEHDWSSHACDQLRMFALGYLDVYDKPRLRQAINYSKLRPTV